MVQPTTQQDQGVQKLKVISEVDMSEVSLQRFNELVHPDDPQPLTTLRGQAATGRISGAYKRGKKWFVDMQVYNREKQNRFTHLDASADLPDNADEAEEREFIESLSQRLRAQKNGAT